MIVTKNIEVIRFLRDRMSGTDNTPQSTTPFSDRLVYEALRASRAMLIYQKAKARDTLNLQNYQTISCIPLKEVPLAECPCAPKSGCSFLITEVDIPTPIGEFYSVSSIDGTINYSYVPWDRFQYKLNDRYASTSGGAFFTTKNTKNGVRLYLYNDIHKELVSITAIFGDPIKIYQYPKCDGGKELCPTPLEYPFPIDPDLLPSVYQMASDMLRPRSETADKVNNDSDDTWSQTPIR